MEATDAAYAHEPHCNTKHDGPGECPPAAPGMDVSFPGPIEWMAEPFADGYGTVTVGSWGGWLVQIVPMIFNNRLVLTPAHMPLGYDHGWCYPKGPAALLAAYAWDPGTEGEPAGYIKRATSRIRKAGETA